jgi:Bacterial Ig domain
MYHFTVENIEASVNGCQTCCCEKLSLKPGTTTKVSVGYAPWAVPIGELHCPPQFMIEQMATCPVPVGDNMPPAAVSEVKFSTPMNAQLDNDLTVMIQDPEAVALTFKLLQLYGAKHGKLTLQPNGAFTYMPISNFVGEERFYVSASDGVNSVVFEVMIAVGIDPAAMAPMPHISIGPAVIDQRMYIVSFPVTMSPAAQQCEIWRMTVLQNAIDCDCNCYNRTDCFDIGVAKC